MNKYKYRYTLMCRVIIIIIVIIVSRFSDISEARTALYSRCHGYQGYFHIIRAMCINVYINIYSNLCRLDRIYGDVGMELFAADI